MEINRWKTVRRCHECLLKGNTNYLWAQPWGKDDMDHPQFKLDCLECGFHELSHWNGK
jgi:hypothetical protein